LFTISDKDTKRRPEGGGRVVNTNMNRRRQGRRKEKGESDL